MSLHKYTTQEAANALAGISDLHQYTTQEALNILLELVEGNEQGGIPSSITRDEENGRTTIQDAGVVLAGGDNSALTLTDDGQVSLTGIGDMNLQSDGSLTITGSSINLTGDVAVNGEYLSSGGLPESIVSNGNGETLINEGNAVMSVKTNEASFVVGDARVAVKGNGEVEIATEASQIKIGCYSDATIRIGHLTSGIYMLFNMIDGAIHLYGLPGVDPEIYNALWVDPATRNVKLSAG